MKGGVKVRHPGKPKKWIAGTAKAFLSGWLVLRGGVWGIGEDDHVVDIYIYIYLNGNIQGDQTKGSTTTKKVPVPPKKKNVYDLQTRTNVRTII